MAKETNKRTRSEEEDCTSLRIFRTAHNFFLKYEKKNDSLAGTMNY